MPHESSQLHMHNYTHVLYYDWAYYQYMYNHIKDIQVWERSFGHCFQLFSCYRKAKGMDLSDLGIIYMYAGMNQGKIVQQDTLMRECSVCKLRGSKDLFKTWFKSFSNFYMKNINKDNALLECGIHFWFDLHVGCWFQHIKTFSSQCLVWEEGYKNSLWF